MYGTVVEKLPTEQYANHYSVKGDNDEIFVCWYAGDDVLAPGTVLRLYDESQSKFVVKRDQGPEAIASYHKIGPLLDPGTRVMIALVGMGKWEIIAVI